MTEVKLPVFGLVALFQDGRGTIVSDLHEEGDSMEKYAAIETLEAIVLGHAMHDVDICAQGYCQGLTIAFNAITAAHVDSKDNKTDPASPVTPAKLTKSQRRRQRRKHR